MFKKLCFTCGVLMVSLFGMSNVNAEAYDQDDFLELISKETPITAEDTLTVGGSKYIGTDGSFTISDGSVTFSLDESIGEKRILMTVDGDVMLNSGEKFFIKVPDALESIASSNGIKGFSLLVTKDSNFNINGTVIIPNVGNGKITNNGIVNVNGVIELRSLGNYTATGTTNVSGKFVIYGINGSNLDSNTNITLKSTGAVYSDYEFSTNMFLSGESGMKVVSATVKDYDSVTDSVVTAAGNNTFAYGYELAKMNDEEIVIPDDDKIDESIPDYQNKEEQIVNPKTFDGIYISMILAIISLIGLKVISKKILLEIN